MYLGKKEKSEISWRRKKTNIHKTHETVEGLLRQLEKEESQSRDEGGHANVVGSSEMG